MKYFIQRGNASFGPYSVEELQGFLAAGRTRGDELVRPESGGGTATVAQAVAGQVPVPPVQPPAITPPVAETGTGAGTPTPAGTGSGTGLGLDHPAAGIGTTVGSVEGKRGSLRWLWISLGVLGVFIIAVAVGAVLLVRSVKERLAEIRDAQFSEVSMAEERAAHTTEWTESGFEPAGAPESPPDGVAIELAHYPSAVGELAAYLTPDPGDGARHPAVVWAHGGFEGIGSYLWDTGNPANDQSAQAFRDAGIVLMAPSWRGEHDNPGRFELFYGEVDDLLAAVEFCRGLSYVDPERVYIAGHSSGGTLVLLAAASGDERFRAAFSIGGSPDQVEALADGGYGNTPYAGSSTRDHELRSPIRYTRFIRRPTFYFEGGDSFYSHVAGGVMEEFAGRNGIPFEAFEIEDGDHFDILAPVTALIAEKIAADTGAECNIAFGRSELQDAWEKLFHVDLAAELARWKRGETELETIRDRLEPTDGLSTEAQVEALADALVHARTLPGEERVTAVAGIAEILNMSIDDQFRLGPAAEIGMPGVREWLAGELAEWDGSELGEDETSRRIDVLGALTFSGDTESALVVARAAAADFAPGGNWEFVFSNIVPEDPGFAPMLDALRDDPPGGPIGIALREHASQCLLAGEWDGETITHPYDSPLGAAFLKHWIETPADQGGDPFGAAFALGFCQDPSTAPLRELAMRHQEPAVRLEAAWSDCRQGGEAGRNHLVEASLDPDWSGLAVRYLRELEEDAAIPEAALEPAFAAKAEMVGWLRHPNELGDSPLTIEEFDSRRLAWPPSGNEERELRLFEFTYPDQDPGPDAPGATKTGYGLVGGEITWASFEEHEEPPTPEQLYAHHCRIELGTPRYDDDGNPIEQEEIDEVEALRRLREANPGAFGG